MGGQAKATGPDFSAGIPLAQVKGTMAGRVGDEPVLLSRIDGQLFAVSGTCTHYGAALADGLVDGDAVRCPLHHACFSLRTGAALAAPAFDGLQQWQVEIEEDQVFVRHPRQAEAPAAAHIPDVPAQAEAVVIVGGGAAGYACALELRRLGYGGRITMISADEDAPYDRPNLSKDFLAGTAPDEWMPLRDAAFYREAGIELRLGRAVTVLDLGRRMVITDRGEEHPFDRLLLATGAEPVRLTTEGFDRDNVHSLRSMADARALAAHARPGARAAIIGSSFIGLEAAAALRSRGVEVAVVSRDSLPFARQFGREVGQFLQRLFEQQGVRFRLTRTPAGFDGRTLRLDDGSVLEADFILAGVGVRPRTDLAKGRMAVADGIVVDAHLATTVPGIYAAGDVAAYPDPVSGTPIRIEHWVTAQRQGQAAASNMLGLATPFRAVPFFWSELFGLGLRYVGHCRHWDEIRIDGAVESGSFTARYYKDGTLRAVLSAGRDRENLEEEVAMEQRIAGTASAGDRTAHAPASQPVAG